MSIYRKLGLKEQLESESLQKTPVCGIFYNIAYLVSLISHEQKGRWGAVNRGLGVGREEGRADKGG